MNYRHHYHAGNYADVFKHALLLILVRAMQRKEKGFLFLDTHAGRGAYDLTVAPVLPGGREREPEWPAGIGRLWTARTIPQPLQEYAAIIRQFNERKAGSVAPAGGPQWYPGSPWLARMLARPQDRLAFCELRPDDAEALAHEFRGHDRASVHASDGYAAIRAMLPPAERRALVLIDPPFESKDETDAVAGALREAIGRLPGAVIALWYPITERARADGIRAIVAGSGKPACAAELEVAGDSSQVRMKGCGVAVINPPWKIDAEAEPLLRILVGMLRVDDRAAARFDWLVPET